MAEALTTATAATDAATTTDTTTTDAAATTATETEIDYKAKYEAQQKVNKDLEKKFNEARTGLDKMSTLEADIARLQGKEAEFLAEQEKRKFEQEALSKSNLRAIRSEVKALAAGKLADPTDALALLDLSKFDVNEEGDVDTTQVESAIADLIARKPHLAAKGAAASTFLSPGANREGDGAVQQYTKEQLNNMSRADIVKAIAEGKAKDALSGK